METVTTTATQERESALHPHNLRILADVLEQAQLPGSVHAGVTGSGTMSIDVFTYDTDDLREARRIVGRCEKQEGPTGMTLRGDLGGVPVTIYPPSGTCRQVQVGTETVTREEPVETRTVTEEVPVFEWECGDVLRDEPEQVPA